MSSKELALEEALQSLPHGPEFRFVDRLLELEPGIRGRGGYRIRGDEPFLKGHFPGDPLMPGVLLVEAAAQLAGVVAQTAPNILPLVGLRLAALQGVKIRGTARPGEVIGIEAQVTGRLGGLVQASAEVWGAKQELLTARLTLAGELPET